MADKKISALTGATTPLAGTEVLPIVQGGETRKVSVANLTAGRAVAMAGGSFTDNITQSTAAKGVNFTANTPAAGMTSRLLNWYEEGTWTPTIIGDSGAASGYSAQSGRYTRFGRTVFVSFHIALTNKGTISGEAKLGGLPFTVTNNGVSARATLSISIWESLATAKSWVALYTIANTTTAYFVASAGAVISSENGMNTSVIGNSTVFVGSGVYEVA